MKILLLEDDTLLGETIEEMLNDAGHKVFWAKDGHEASDATFDTVFDLYILDINVPKLNGLKVLEELRDTGDDTRVIFISALSDMVSITKGFKLGAEDYIKKPFFPEELIVRIEAKIAKSNMTIEHDEICFNPQNNEVRRANQLITLGDVQLPLLRIFIQNIGKTLLKENLFELMEHPSDSALRVAINKLKKTTGWKIQNIRAVGYRLE